MEPRYAECGKGAAVLVFSDMSSPTVGAHCKYPILFYQLKLVLRSIVLIKRFSTSSYLLASLVSIAATGGDSI